MKKRNVLIGLVVAGLAVTYAVAATPGSDSDPVISLSYLTEVFKPEIRQETQYQLVNLSAGQKLVGGMGAEMILRMGSANVIATDLGGISDVTLGYDLSGGIAVPANHHLIVPRDDGRGVVATADCIFMVKGTYQIQ